MLKAAPGTPDWSRHANFMMRHIGCGHMPPEYYVSFGYYYCFTYGDKLLPRLSPAGQRWLKNARKKLQENMENGLADNMIGDIIDIPSREFPGASVHMSVPQYTLEITNTVFQNFAFNTHVPAYLEAGLADLPLSDLLTIAGQPNIEEWTTARMWKQASEVLYRNFKEDTQEAWDATQEFAGDVGDAVEQALNKLMSYF